MPRAWDSPAAPLHMHSSAEQAAEPGRQHRHQGRVELDMASPSSQKDGIPHPPQRHIFPQSSSQLLCLTSLTTGEHIQLPHLHNLVLNQEASSSFASGGGITMSQSLGILFGETLQFMEHLGQPVEQERA